MTGQTTNYSIGCSLAAADMMNMLVWRSPSLDEWPEWPLLPWYLTQTASHSQSPSWFNWNESEKMNQRASSAGSGSVQMTPTRSRDELGVDLIPPCEWSVMSQLSYYKIFDDFAQKLLHKNYRARLKDGPQVWWNLLLLMLTTSVWLCLQHSCNLGTTF